MAIVDTNVIRGPEIHADGQHRGVLEFTFDDGRKVKRDVRAPDSSAWANQIVDLAGEVQKSQEKQDADEGVNSEAEIVANKQSSVEQRAVAYLRRAWDEENPYDAFMLFDKFNDFRLSKGWNLNQVRKGLENAGLSVEEWEDIKKAYQYLASGGRPAVMNTAQTIQEKWDNR